MKLIMESWRGYIEESLSDESQLPDEKTDLLFDRRITAMIEKAGMLEEGNLRKMAQDYAMRYGVPLATALALMSTVPAGVMAGKSLANKHNTELAAQQADQASAERQAFIDQYGADFGELPAEYDELSNDAITDRAWDEYANRDPIAAPVSGMLTVVSGGNIEGRPFMVYEILPNDIMPLNQISAEDYRAQVQAKLEEDGERGIEYLRNQLFGDTGKWLSGSDNEMFRMVDGNPILPPEWSVAYDVYAEAVVDRVAHIRGVASISPEYGMAVSRAFNLDDTDPQALEDFLQHELWKVGAAAASDETE